MQEYINPKSKKEKEKENKPKEKDIIKRKKYINNKKKIMINNLSFDFPLEYNKDIINTKISK